jgi:tRNA threonylcarbamoyladenosine biosynthesis protein TsaE
MDIQYSYALSTHSAEETRHLGYLFGQHLKSGSVLRLVGELGCGKTCFVQGLAKGLDVPDAYPVTSPTYALMHDFPGRIPLVHVDLYRIHGEADADSIGLWEVVNEPVIVAVEWADRLDVDYWPESSIEIRFAPREDDSRSIVLNACGLQMVNLIQEIGTLWKTV